MSSYIISGSSDKFDTSECENLANMIRSFYNDISFKIVLKDPSEWESYIDEICRIYGFKTKSNPIIYTIDGKLIGDRQAFVNLAETRFGISNPKLRQGPITPDINKKAAKIELDQKLKLQKQKKTLTEKIEYNTLKILNENLVKPTEGFYQHKFMNGINYYVKYEQRLCPPYILQTDFKKDEQRIHVDEEDTVLAEVIGEDGKKTKKYIQMFAERFVTLEHKNYQAQQLQQQQELLNGVGDPKNSSTKGGFQETQQNFQLISSKPSEMNTLTEFPHQEHEIAQSVEGGVEGNPEELEDVEQNQILENEEDDRPDTAPINLENIQGQPKQIKVNDYIVHKFKNGMFLMIHPQPLIEGHYILFEPLRKQGQLPGDPEDIYLQDYSEVIRGRYNSFKAMIKSNSNSSEIPRIQGLYNNHLDIFKSITLETCYSIVKLITKVDVVISMNILSQEFSSFLPLSNGHINVLLRKFGQLQISNKHILGYLSDPTKRTSQQNSQKQLFPLEEYLLDQKSKCYSINKNVYAMKDLDIIHYIAFPEKLLTPEQTHLNIINLFTAFLEKNLNAPLQMGCNLIISKYIIFFAPKFNPYSVINNINVHLPSFAYLGILNLPLDKNNDQKTETNFFGLLKKTQTHKDKLTTLASTEIN